MIYEYRCLDCGYISELPIYLPIGQIAHQPCQFCGALRRRIASSPAIIRTEPEVHFNHTTGQVVHNRRDFHDQLKYKNDEMSERTGFESNYQPVDLRDKEACHVTDEGINE